MKSKTKVRLAAGLTAGAMMLSLSGPAFAQPTQINTGSLVSALNNVNVEIDQLNVLNDLTIIDVRVVNVEDSVNNNRILNNNQTDITVLRDFLNNSLNNNDVNVLTIENVLNNSDIDIRDVVAIDVLRNGDVVVFVDVL